MNRKSRTLILIVGVVEISILTIIPVEVRAQDQNTLDFADRLEELGVPLKNARVASRLPLPTLPAAYPPGLEGPGEGSSGERSYP